jgi:transposase
VQLVVETGEPIAQVARDLGINEGTLGSWCAQGRRARKQDRSLDRDERAELERLRREVIELRMQRDVLKRSVALCVDEAMGWSPWPSSSSPRGRTTRSRTRPAAGRWESARRGSTSGGTVTPHRGMPAGHS